MITQQFIQKTMEQGPRDPEFTNNAAEIFISFDNIIASDNNELKDIFFSFREQCRMWANVDCVFTGSWDKPSVKVSGPLGTSKISL